MNMSNTLLAFLLAFYSLAMPMNSEKPAAKLREDIERCPILQEALEEPQRDLREFYDTEDDYIWSILEPYVVEVSKDDDHVVHCYPSAEPQVLADLWLGKVEQGELSEDGVLTVGGWRVYFDAEGDPICID